MTAIFNVLLSIFMVFVALLSSLNLDTSTKETSVELYTNPASGYTWEYSMDKIGYLTLTETNYTSDSGSILKGKGGGTQTFTFISIRSGTVSITFRYVKYDGFEKIIASEYIYTYDIAEDGTVSLRSIQ